MPGAVTHVEDIPAPGAAAADEAAAAAAAAAADTQVAERPEHIPEKFWDAEKGTVNTDALLASYTELEGKMSGGEADAAAAGDESKKPEGEESEEDAEARKAVEDAGLNFDTFSTEYMEHGRLSADSYKKLADAGIPNAMVDQFIAGQEALALDIANSMYAEAGSKVNYENAMKWGAVNLPQAEKDAFDKAMDGSKEEILLAVRSLVTRYEEAEGSDGKQITGKPAGRANSGGGYNSWAEVTAAMKDPRYARDVAYQKEVQAKLAISELSQ